MSSLTEQVGTDVPTLDEVRDKIEQRYAKAKGMSDLQGMSVESKMLEVEQASVNFEAQARLSEIRSKLGIGDGAAEPAAAEQAAGEPAAAETPSEPATATEGTTEPGATPG
jgi:phage shock protein A